MADFPLHLCLTDAQGLVKPRAQESKIGQVMRCLTINTNNYSSELARHIEQGARVALVGVPESIGPQANLGKGGAEGGWDAFLQIFLNYQATAALPVDQLLLVGHVDCADLMAKADALQADDPQRLDALRNWCDIIDQRVMSVVQPLFDAGFEVILIGGGHNNAFPLLQSLHESSSQPCAAVNLDPHADFRLREGRHSGNGFSYAHASGALAHYHVLSLHEGKNSAVSLRQLSDAGFTYHSMHHIHLNSFRFALDETLNLVGGWQAALGIEVDVDAIMQAPASALNYTGVSMSEGYQFVARTAALENTRYLHLAEAAPVQHPAGTAAGAVAAGQLLSELTLAYLFGREQRDVCCSGKNPAA